MYGGWFSRAGPRLGKCSTQGVNHQPLMRTARVFARLLKLKKTGHYKCKRDHLRFDFEGEIYRIFWPRPERTSSTPSNAVRLCSSRMGLISTTSREVMASESAIISMARW